MKIHSKFSAVALLCLAPLAGCAPLEESTGEDDAALDNGRGIRASDVSVVCDATGKHQIDENAPGCRREYREALKKCIADTYNDVLTGNGGKLLSALDSRLANDVASLLKYDDVRQEASDLPFNLRRLIKNETFILNLNPAYTGKFMGWSSEDDMGVFDGRNVVFRIDRTPSKDPKHNNTGRIRTNFTQKFAQVCLYGNKEIPASAHAAKEGFRRFRNAIMLHEILHSHQYDYNAVPYLIDALHADPSLMSEDPSAPNYGLIPRGVLTRLSAKISYEEMGFRMSKSFYRGGEPQILKLAERLDAYRRAPQYASEFAPGGRYEWLGVSPRRDIVEKYFKADASIPQNNIYTPGVTPFPASFQPYMYGQFRAAELANDMADLAASASPNPGKFAAVKAEWQSIIGVQKDAVHPDGRTDLDDYIDEFPYVKFVVARFERDAENVASALP